MILLSFLASEFDCSVFDCSVQDTAQTTMLYVKYHVKYQDLLNEMHEMMLTILSSLQTLC